MKVKELIRLLEQCENKELEVYLYHSDDIHPIQMVDELDDRVDINEDEEEETEQ